MCSKRKPRDCIPIFAVFLFNLEDWRSTNQKCFTWWKTGCGERETTTTNSCTTLCTPTSWPMMWRGVRTRHSRSGWLSSSQFFCCFIFCVIIVLLQYQTYVTLIIKAKECIKTVQFHPLPNHIFNFFFGSTLKNGRS